MSLDYINEAFRSLELLNEGVFSTDTSGLHELADFMDTADENETIQIIDMDAETEDELQDSYIGKIICDCNVCHSHMFTDKDQIQISDDGEIDIDVDCPYCGERNGFTIIGEIHAFNPAAEEEVAEETPAEEEEIIEEPAKEIAESLNESLLTDYKKFVDRDDIDEADMMFEESIMPDIMDAAEKILISRGYSDIEFDPDQFRDRVRASKNNVTYEAQFEIADQYEDFGSVLYNSNNYSDAVKRCADMYVKDIIDNFEALTESLNESSRKFKPHTIKLLKMIGSDLVRDDEVLEEGRFIDGVKSLLGRKPTTNKSAEQKWALVDTQYDRVVYVFDTREEAEAAWKRKPQSQQFRFDVRPLTEDLKMMESFNNVSIETDDQRMTMTSEEGGKVTVTTEPIEAPASEEVIAPVSRDVQDEILDVNTEEDNLEEPAEEASVDFDIDEFDEEGMDELGESYLRKVYDNVNSFKTSAISSADNKLFVEGFINFKSGSSKKTGFIFEAVDATKEGKVKFIGENAHLCRGKKAFTLVGSMNKNKLFVESFTYNYRAKNPDGKSVRLYGKITKK